jgi:hypothetical protein
MAASGDGMNPLIAALERAEKMLLEQAAEITRLTNSLSDAIRERDEANAAFKDDNHDLGVTLHKLEEVTAYAEQFKWIPVTERPLPRGEFETFLVTNDKGHVAPWIRGVIHNNVGTAWDWEYGARVTHWMPMPAAPVVHLSIPSAPPSIEDAEFDRIMAMSDEQVMAEARAEGRDPVAFAERMRGFVEGFGKAQARSRNYVADREVDPQQVTFANGRMVTIRNGHLVIGDKDGDCGNGVGNADEGPLTAHEGLRYFKRELAIHDLVDEVQALRRGVGVSYPTKHDDPIYRLHPLGHRSAAVAQIKICEEVIARHTSTPSQGNPA